MQNRKLIASSIGIATVFLVLISFLTSSGGPSGFFVPQNKTKCQDVQEAYSELQPFEKEQCVTVPFTETRCDNKTLVYSKDQKCYWSGSPLSTLNSECTITNLDNYGGNFVVNVGLITKENNTGEEQSAYIYPQSSYTFKYSSQVDIGACFCDEKTIPTEELCKENFNTKQECYNITSFRNVTSYKTIQKCD